MATRVPAATDSAAGRDASRVCMTDDDWAALEPGERDFAVRWLGLSEGERDDFCRQLLAAIEVLQRFRVLDGGTEGSATT